MEYPKNNNEIYQLFFESPIGWMKVAGTDAGLTEISFVDAPGETNIQAPAYLFDCIDQLEEYFAGERKVFDLMLSPGGTDFRHLVWLELMKIPYGKTRSYADIAHALDNPGSIRAVGAANGANPLAIVVPCHRVIGSDGSLTGYAGGLWRKKWLLEFESGAVSKTLF